MSGSKSRFSHLPHPNKAVLGLPRQQQRLQAPPSRAAPGPEAHRALGQLQADGLAGWVGRCCGRRWCAGARGFGNEPVLRIPVKESIGMVCRGHSLGSLLRSSKLEELGFSQDMRQNKRSSPMVSFGLPTKKVSTILTNSQCTVHLAEAFCINPYHHWIQNSPCKSQPSL